LMLTATLVIGTVERMVPFSISVGSQETGC